MSCFGFIFLTVVLAVFQTSADAQCSLDYVCIAVNVATIRPDPQERTLRAVTTAIQLAGYMAGTGAATQFAMVRETSWRSAFIDFQTWSSDTEAQWDAVKGQSLKGRTRVAKGFRACKTQLFGKSGRRLMVFIGGSLNALLNEAKVQSDQMKAEGITVATFSVSEGNGILPDLPSPGFFFNTLTPTFDADAMQFSRTVCRSATGAGDPHLIGFDGKRFDFHGHDGGHYAVFGRYEGDLLVSTVRGVRTKVDAEDRNLTFFGEFALQPAGTANKVRVAMLPCKRTNVWELGTEVDGVVVKLDGSWPHFSLQKATSSKVEIRTREARYEIKLMWPENADTAHLNLMVSLARVPRQDDIFHGMIGLSLNKQLGREEDSDLLLPAAEREVAVTKRFELQSSFPKWNTGIVSDLTARDISYELRKE